MTRTHLIVRPDHILCTRCFKTEPITCGNGTPMDTLWLAHEMMAERHQGCVPLKAGERRTLSEPKPRPDVGEKRA